MRLQTDPYRVIYINETLPLSWNSFTFSGLFSWKTDVPQFYWITLSAMALIKDRISVSYVEQQMSYIWLNFYNFFTTEYERIL